LLKKLYGLYWQKTALDHGSDKLLSGLPLKRRCTARRTVAPMDPTPETVSLGYAECTECTLASFNALCKYMYDEAPEHLRMGAQRIFLDIGPGYGKCVLHAAIRKDVERSVGIEYDTTRFEKSEDMMEVELRQQYPPVSTGLQPRSSC
jgi:hypothetical protein